MTWRWYEIRWHEFMRMWDEYEKDINQCSQKKNSVRFDFRLVTTKSWVHSRRSSQQYMNINQHIMRKQYLRLWMLNHCVVFVFIYKLVVVVWVVLCCFSCLISFCVVWCEMNKNDKDRSRSKKNKKNLWHDINNKRCQWRPQDWNSWLSRNMRQ